MKMEKKGVGCEGIDIIKSMEHVHKENTQPPVAVECCIWPLALNHYCWHYVTEGGLGEHLVLEYEWLSVGQHLPSYKLLKYDKYLYLKHENEWIKLSYISLIIMKYMSKSFPYFQETYAY